MQRQGQGAETGDDPGNRFATLLDSVQERARARIRFEISRRKKADKKFNQKAVAELAGMNEAVLSLKLSGGRNLELSDLVRIAAALGVEVADLVVPDA
jgi:DNA-binding Xre family transcriptional regulator